MYVDDPFFRQARLGRKPRRVPAHPGGVPMASKSTHRHSESIIRCFCNTFCVREHLEEVLRRFYARSARGRVRRSSVGTSRVAASCWQHAGGVRFSGTYRFSAGLSSRRSQSAVYRGPSADLLCLSKGGSSVQTLYTTRQGLSAVRIYQQQCIDAGAGLVA
jgi:hypothetical protein